MLYPGRSHTTRYVLVVCYVVLLEKEDTVLMLHLGRSHTTRYVLVVCYVVLLEKENCINVTPTQ